MTWYIIAALSFLAAIALLVYTRVRDRRYEKKRVLEAMSPELRAEIEEEREASIQRREKFLEALKQAKEAKGTKE